MLLINILRLVDKKLILGFIGVPDIQLDFINICLMVYLLSSALVFLDPDPPSISILCGWSKGCDQCGVDSIPVFFLL